MTNSSDDRLAIEFVASYSCLTFFILAIFAASFFHYHWENREKYQRRKLRVQALKEHGRSDRIHVGPLKPPPDTILVRTRMTMLYNKIDVRPIVTHFAMGLHEDLSLEDWQQISKSPMGHKRKRINHPNNHREFGTFRSALSSSDNSSLGKTDSDSDYTEIEDCAHEDPNRRKKIEKLNRTNMKRRKTRFGGLSVSVSVLNHPN